MSLYEVQKLLFRLNRDEKLQARFRTNRDEVLSDYRLDEDERVALEAADVGRLYVMGVHPLLLLGFGTRAGYAWPEYIGRLKNAQEEKGGLMLVFAAAGSHAPGITARAELAPARERELFHTAYRTLQQELEATRADALVLVTAEHFTNFFLDNMPAFCLGLAERFEGPVEEESFLRLKKGDVPGAPGIARALAEHLSDGIDLAHSQELSLDHGAIIPLHFLTPRFDVPVVPIIVNCFAPPLPPLARCWELGRALRSAIDAVPERIALFGAGGISHWPAMPESGRVNAAWDRRFLENFAARRRTDLLAYTNGEISREAGPGGHEIRAWLAVAGATEGYSGELLCAEPVQAFAITAAVARFSRA